MEKERKLVPRTLFLIFFILAIIFSQFYFHRPLIDILLFLGQAILGIVGAIIAFFIFIGFVVGG